MKVDMRADARSEGGESKNQAGGGSPRGAAGKRARVAVRASFGGGGRRVEVGIG